MLKLTHTLLRFVLQSYFRLFFRFKIYGTAPTHLSRTLVVANHASFFDPPLLGISYPTPIHFLARDTLFRFPLFRMLIRSLHAHPVKRNQGDLSAVKTVCRLLHEGKPVVLFPEGTRSHSGEIGPIRGGCGLIAAQTQCDIVPIYIDGSSDAWGRKRALPRLHGKISCVIGHPIYWEDYRHMEKKAAQKAVTFEIERRLHALRKWTQGGAQGPIP